MSATDRFARAKAEKASAAVAKANASGTRVDNEDADDAIDQASAARKFARQLREQ